MEGTGHILPRERESASFSIERMTEAIYGGPDAVKRRRFILLPAQQMQYPDRHEWSREKLMTVGIKDFIDIHKDFVMEGYRPQRDEIAWMGEVAMLTNAMMPHMGLFLPTILGQGSTQQIMAWLPRAVTFQMIGCYAQTELSHGSNIRGLRTTATYDAASQEFIMSTNGLGSTKWWNSNIGCVATHAAVYAQLIINGKNYGLHVFMVQVRDENHNLLPGVLAGDCGPKLGDHGIDTGFLQLNDVRIPRQHLFSKRQHVEPDGTYVRHVVTKSEKEASLSKRAAYLTMMQARAGMTSIAAGKLSIGLCIAIRYSAVRTQGFVNSGEGVGFQSPEQQVIDYKVQQSRLFGQLAICFAIRASGNWMNAAISKFSDAANGLDDANEDKEDLFDSMPSIHASSAGLKGVCVKLASDGLEDLRKCCGGHGYLLSSGIGSLASDFVWQATAEGDFVVLLLQTARYLIKSRKQALSGERVHGLVSCLAPLNDPNFSLESHRPRDPTSIEDLSLEYLKSVFKFRTLAKITRAGSLLDNKISSGIDVDTAWNDCAIQLKNAAEAHIHYFMLCNFIELIRAQDDPFVAPILENLCALYALQQMQDGLHFGGLLTPRQVDLSEIAIGELHKRLRPEAVAIVDSFDIPDRLLGALGRSDGKVYEALLESAKSSSLNQKSGPFEGYKECLEPHLDKAFLALRNKPCEELLDVHETESRL